MVQTPCQQKILKMTFHKIKRNESKGEQEGHEQEEVQELNSLVFGQLLLAKMVEVFYYNSTDFKPPRFRQSHVDR